MRLHESTSSRRLFRITALGLAVAASGLVGSSPADAAGACGASPSDMFGTFLAYRTPPKDAPDAGTDQPMTAMFTAPDQMRSDNKVQRGGEVFATVKGSGTFSVQPLKWMEKGTMTIGDQSGPYEYNFEAWAVECAGDTKVSRFTGTFTNRATPDRLTVTYTRTS